MKSANGRRDRRQKHQKPRRQSSVVQPLLRLSYRTRFRFFFLMHTVIFMYSHTETQCLLSWQNWVHTSVLQEVSFSLIFQKAFVDCGDSVQLQVSLLISNIQIMRNTSLRKCCYLSAQCPERCERRCCCWRLYQNSVWPVRAAVRYGAVNARRETTDVTCSTLNFESAAAHMGNSQVD